MSLAFLFINILIFMLFYLGFHYSFFKTFNVKKLIMFNHFDIFKQNDIWSIPGPLNIPFIGTKWIFMWKYKLSQMHKVYEDFNKKYGQIALEVTPNGIPIVLLFDRLDIDTVLRYPSKYPCRPETSIVAAYRRSRPDRYASVGITNEQGETWHKLRSQLTPLMTSPKHLQAFLPILNVIVDDFISLLRTRRCPDTDVVENFQDIANLMGLEAVCALMLGRRMGFLSPNPSSKVELLAITVKKMFIALRDSNYGFGLWRYLPTKLYSDYAQLEEIIYNLITEIVDEANISPDQSIDSDECDVRSIFLNILNNPALDIRDKKSAIIDFISAGIETLATSLCFLLYYTTKDDIQNRIREEFLCDLHGEVTRETINEAKYTKAAIHETYRICPTAYCIARVLEEDLVLSEYKVKKGTVVLCQTMVACNDDKNFLNAKEFNPNRWLSDDEPADTQRSDPRLNLGKSLVAPFGIGKRMCPGRRFVDMELNLLLAKLFLEFNVSYCGELETEFEFLLVPKTPVNIKLTDRL